MPEFAAACAREGHRLHRPVGRGDSASGIENRRANSGQAGGRARGARQRRAGQRVEHARALAREIGYPVLLKAAAGGGGKGMRRVNHESELESAIRDASSEAERAFHNGEVYIEKLIEKPRHIEIQIAGDHYGNLVHLGERECSHPAASSKDHRRMPVAVGRAGIPNCGRPWAKRR